MQDNQIYFNIKDDKVKLSFKNKTMSIQDFLTVISTGILNALLGVVQAAPKEQQQQVKEELYDMYNAAASNTLSYFAPEIDMRPHLTAQAILEAENAILDREYKRVKANPNYRSPLADSAPPAPEPEKLKAGQAQLNVIRGGK